MPIHETTADKMTNPASPRRGSLAVMKDKLMGGGTAQPTERPVHTPTADELTNPPQGRRGSFARMQEKFGGGGDATQQRSVSPGAAPASPTGRRSSFAVMHDKLQFYQEAPTGPPPKVNVREATADELLNPQAGGGGRRSSFARMQAMMGGRK